MTPSRCGIAERLVLSISLMARWSAWSGVSFESGRCALALPGDEAADGIPIIIGAIVLSPLRGVAGNTVVGVTGGVSSITGGLAGEEELVIVIPRNRIPITPNRYQYG